MLPKEIAKRVPKTHLMSETEWRNLGVQQSQGWVHYMIHQPGILAISTQALHLHFLLVIILNCTCKNVYSDLKQYGKNKKTKSEL